MIKLATHFLAVVFALLLVARYVPGVHVESLTTAVIVALILGVINITVRPLLVLLTLPITILTLGLFIFIINALMFWLVSVLVAGFTVDGFVPALVGSLTVSVVSAIARRLLG